MEVHNLQLQQQQAAAVQSVLLTPFDAPSVQTLYVLWGWLLPITPPQPSAQEPLDASNVSEAGPPAGNVPASSTGLGPSRLLRPEGGIGGGCERCHVAQALAQDAVDNAQCCTRRQHMQLQGQWHELAAALHDIVCSLGRRGERTVRMERDVVDSQVRLLQDRLHAYQVPLGR